MADNWFENNWWISLTVFALIGIGVLLIFPFLLKSSISTLAVLLIIGVIALIMALTDAAVVFRYLKLADPKEALGLPAGSVRAVIALSLILLFMISSLFLYVEVNSYSAPQIMVSENVTQQQADAIPQASIAFINKTSGTGNDTLYDVGRIIPNTDKTGEDLAKQVITTVSTLVVAVSSFYFGSAASKPSTTTPETSTPSIEGIEPSTGERGKDISLTVTGKNFDDAPEVKLVLGNAEMKCTGIISNPTTIKCTLNVPTDTKAYPTGKWQLIVTNSDQGEDKHANAFTVS